MAASTGAKTVTAVSTSIANGVESMATATAHIGASGIGFLGGLGVGAGAGTLIEMLLQANRKEKAFGKQGGAEGGSGSVTNKTEAQMHKLATMAAETEEEQQPVIQPDEITREDLPNGAIIRKNGEFYYEIEELKGETFAATGQTELHFSNKKGELIAVEKPVIVNEDGEEVDAYEYYDGKGNRITREEYQQILSSQ